MRYKYKARTKEGKLQKGTIEASSRKSALYILEKYEFYVTSLRETEEEGILGKKISFHKISSKDLIIFTRQLGVMLKSAISPIEALRAQVTRIENSDFREKILKISELIEGGESLSRAFSMFPKIFDSFYIGVIKSGEVTGRTADSLNYLAKHLEREYEFNRKLRNAMIYPVFVIVVFIAVFFLAIFFIIPRLTEVLKAFGGELPLMTRIVISFSNFIKKGGWIIITGILVFLFFVPQYLKRAKFSRESYDKFLLQLPIIGDLNKKIYLTRFAENLSVSLSTGLPITQALKIARDIIKNLVYKKIITEAQEKVSKGENISSVFSRYPKEIPPFVLQMILTGEKAGRLYESLMEIVRFYRDEIDRTTSSIFTLIEPILILFLGIGVAILVISIFIPLFNIGAGGLGM